MNRAPADYREFIRVAVDLPANPKLAMIDNPAAGWAYVVSLCYCGQHLTDGSFPKGPLLRLAGVKPAVAKALIEADLWHETGHSCDRCPQPMRGMAVVHDYLVHQRSADEARALRDARREAGRKGAAHRWSSNGDGNSHRKSDGKRYSNSHGNGVAEPSQTDGKPMAEVEVEEEKEQKKTSSSSSATAEPPRDDVDQLCARLRDRMIGNGFKAPAVTVAWRRDARLLLDSDGRDHAQALRLIDWCQADPFWHPNIRSMAKFRAQYDTLLARARQDQQRRTSSPQQQPDRIAGWQNLKSTGTDDRPLYAITGGDST